MAGSSSSSTKDASRISASVPAHIRARIEEAAFWKGMPVGAFIAEAAGKEAEQLSREDAETILSLLENPPKPRARPFGV